MDGQTRSILVVEDEVFVAWDEVQSLECAGFAVIGPAHDLSSAMELAGTSNPDGAVLDVNLGAQTVWPLADQLIALGVPFVFVTADLQHPELRDRYPDVPRLTKPSSELDLVTAVTQLFEGGIAAETGNVSVRR